jgi:hypothetical protein
MIGIERSAIQSDVGAIAARLNEFLRRIVTRLVQRLKRTKPEFVDVAAARCECRRRDDAAIQAAVAERIREHLLPPDPCLARGAIPGVPLRGSAAGSLRRAPEILYARQ